jgi:hypothetical protein
VAEFLGSMHNHILFVDADISFESEAVVNLLLQRRPVIGCTYSNKKAGQTRETATYDVKLYPSNPYQDRKPYISVISMAMGFCLISRSAILDMIQKYPDRHYVNDMPSVCTSRTLDNFYNFFNVEIDTETMELNTEYECFCRLWKAIDPTKNTIDCLLMSNLVHYGKVGFCGNFDPKLDYMTPTSSINAENNATC